jgi:hypothetical protein
MAFVALPGAEIPANPPKQSRRYVAGVGPGTAQYGGVWPNEWPNGQLHHDIERRCVAPGRSSPQPVRLRGRALRCRRARRTRSTATADGVSLRVPDVSLPGAWSQVPLGTRSRGRPASGGEARACRSWRPRALPPPKRALALSSNRAASETSSVAPASETVVEAAVSTRAPGRRPRQERRRATETAASRGGCRSPGRERQAVATSSHRRRDDDCPSAWLRREASVVEEWQLTGVLHRGWDRGPPCDQVHATQETHDG